MADPAVEELDALLSLVLEDWRVRCLSAEHDLEAALARIQEMAERINTLTAVLAKVRRESRYKYEEVARDEDKKKAWYRGYLGDTSFRSLGESKFTTGTS